MSKESFIISCIRRLREYGEGIVLADQSISSLKETAKGNVYTILSLSQSSQKDKREVVNVLGLNSNQAEIINKLEPGEGIVRLVGRYPYPLLLKFPYIKPKNISDEEIDEINAKSDIVQNLLSNVKKGKLKDKREDNKTGTTKIYDKAKDMLLDIYNRFDVASTQRADNLSLSAETSNRIYKYIEKEQLVESIRLNLTGKRGGLSKYHVMTDKGAEIINKPPIKKYSGGTGEKHRFLQRYLKKYLPARGFKELEIEKEFCGKRIDLFGKYKELKIAIEICISTIRTEYLNAQKDMDKCDCLIFVCTDNKTKDKLEKELYKKIPRHKKIRICIVHELLNKADEIIKETMDGLMLF